MRVTAVARPVSSSAVDDDAVQPRIAGRRLEPRRHAGEEARQRRLALHADDRVVRAGHAGVGQIRGAVRQDALVGASARACACRRPA